MQILFQPFEPGLSTVEKVDQPNSPTNQKQLIPTEHNQTVQYLVRGHCQ